MTYDCRPFPLVIRRCTRGVSAGRLPRDIDAYSLPQDRQFRGAGTGRPNRASTWGSIPEEAHPTYVNRCWHYGNEEFVRWTTEDDPDPAGASYPGPGTFGVDTTSPAVVESWTPA